MAEKRVEFKKQFGHSPGAKKLDFRKQKVQKKPKEKPSTEPIRSSTRKRAEVNYCEIDPKIRKKSANVKSAEIGRNISVMSDKDPDVDSPFVCLECNQGYKYRNSLIKHEKAVHQKIEFVCNVCNKLFKFKANLKRHVDVVHSKSDNNKYLCSQCDKSFMYSFTLKKHIKNQHN